VQIRLVGGVQEGWLDESFVRSSDDDMISIDRNRDRGGRSGKKNMKERERERERERVARGEGGEEILPKRQCQCDEA